MRYKVQRERWVRPNDRAILGDVGDVGDVDGTGDGEVVYVQSSATTATASATVETADNHIYLYEEITDSQVLALFKTLRETANRLEAEFVARELPADYPRVPIWLHLQSGGGDTFAALSAVDVLKRLGKTTPVWSVVEGYCASGATLISMACNRRFIRPSAFMMIHQTSGWAGGTYEQLEDNLKMHSLVMERVVKFYIAHSRLSEGQVRALLQRDSWMDAAGCMEHGLVDEMLE